MSERAFGSRRVTTTSASERDARAALKRGCERRKSRADERRNDERMCFWFAKSDDDVGYQARCASSS
jgi:hypothetical protein